MGPPPRPLLLRRHSLTVSDTRTSGKVVALLEPSASWPCDSQPASSYNRAALSSLLNVGYQQLWAYRTYVCARNLCLAGDHLGWFLGSSRAEACRAAENACATKHSTRSQQLDAARQTPTPKGTSVHGADTCRRKCTRGLRPSACARHPYSKPKSVHRGATADNVGAHVSFDRLDLGSARPCFAPTHPISFRPGPYFRNAPNLRFYRAERRSDAGWAADKSKTGVDKHV